MPYSQQELNVDKTNDRAGEKVGKWGEFYIAITEHNMQYQDYF